MNNPISRLFRNLSQDEEVLANGTLSDKKDVENPTVPFQSVRHLHYKSAPDKLKRNVDFFRPEYDLPTIANAVQLDGLLQRAVNIFVEQILKNGYEFTSKNDRLQTHVTRRMKEIQNMTGKAFYDIMQEVARQLVTYGNAFIIKVRSGTKSKIGKNYRLYGKNMKPIVGLFVADATTMEVGLNNRGQVENYRHRIQGSAYHGYGGRQDVGYPYSHFPSARFVYFDERDVIHLTYNKIPGTLTGMSPILPILDDVRALRKLEEEMEILGFQYSIPLYLYKVGTKEQPPAPNEINEVSATVNNMPAYGMLVVPGHHNIEVPTNNNTPVDLISFIKHFKSRIYAGLGVSPIAMGEAETSNRNTAESLDVSMQAITKRYQGIIKSKLEQELIREVMMDGNFNPELPTMAMAFNFPEIDLEAQLKKENNILQKWQNSMITREEARLELDMERGINDKDTFVHLVEIPKILAEGGIQVEVAEIGAKASLQKAKQSASASKAKASTNAKKRATSTANRPRNQHGTSTGRPKIVKNYLEDAIEFSNSLVANLFEDGEATRLNSNTYGARLSDSVAEAFRNQVYLEAKSYAEAFGIKLDDGIDQDVVMSVAREAAIVLQVKVKNLAQHLDDEIKVSIFKSEMERFINVQKDKARNLAKILLFKGTGYVTILLNADECDIHSISNLPVKDISYSRIPPMRYGCNCEVDEEIFYG